ncbi:TPA: restriction endonuclease subunit S [Staphylococcus aureus]|nr:restriction endonuclease subunit S [Staphylococcus aureus]
MSNTQKKNVPELRFPGFEGEWEEKKLGEIAEIVRGASPRPIKDSKWFSKESDIGWLRISDVTEQNGKIYHLDQKLSKEGQEKTRVLLSKHLLLSIAASIGKPVMNFVKTGVHDGFLIFLNPKFNLYFMYYWLEHFKDKWSKYGQPGSQVNLNSEIVKSQNIYLPIRSEQQKIGQFFSKLDRQIELEEQKLELLQQQKKGYMQKIFSQELRFKDENGNDYPDWENVMLQKVLKDKTEGIKRGPFGGALKKDIFVESGYAVYEQRNAIYNINNFRYYINENKYKEMQSFSVQPNDIIMSCSGTIGRLSLIPQNFTKGIINQALIRFRTNHKIRSEFFLIFMRSNQMQRKILEANPGSAITNLVPVKELKLIPFPLPVKFEQDKISQFILIINRRIEQSEKKIESLKNRKQGFLQKLFV